VFSAIGTYVDLRGGLHYPTLIRKVRTEASADFYADGRNDNNKYGGDWWMANQTMERALTSRLMKCGMFGGNGGHTGKQATAVFPDAMRWLCRIGQARSAGPTK